ncbi:Dam family site-specific DNA-(adenine-N6)-methyltransferase [Luteibacter sp.]|jgi:DNA adenine methylase|uniref:DNA adenine methylase n=1 Tax=Luteibacter sp. TaxID=1886636 RepID=UPI002F3FFBAC
MTIMPSDLLASPLIGRKAHKGQPQQLLKWIGNKQRYAVEIISHWPKSFSTYFEPFTGSAAVLGALGPERAVAGDIYAPLIEIWHAVQRSAIEVGEWYAERHALIERMGKTEAYLSVRDSFNSRPNGPDFLFLSRACYGGVVRFRKKDGAMSTPPGPHNPISPEKFTARAQSWHERLQGTEFIRADYREVMARAGAGDVVYCDPPYSDSQSILYGAQDFRLSDLYSAIEACKKRGAFVILSIDGTKKSGSDNIDIAPPESLFEREVFVNCGRSMLRRFQMVGQSLEQEEVTDRLLLTW